MSDGLIQRTVDWAVVRATAYGRDALASVFVGSTLAAVAPAVNARIPDLNIVPQVAFFVGFFGTGTALAFWLAGGKRFEDELASLKRMKDAGLISEPLYLRLVERAATWYAARRFGGPLPPPSAEATRTPRTRRPSPPADPTPPTTTPPPDPS